jgi:hypothetical protein
MELRYWLLTSGGIFKRNFRTECWTGGPGQRICSVADCWVVLVRTNPVFLVWFQVLDYVLLWDKLALCFLSIGTRKGEFDTSWASTDIHDVGLEQRLDLMINCGLSWLEGKPILLQQVMWEATDDATGELSQHKAVKFPRVTCRQIV